MVEEDSLQFILFNLAILFEAENLVVIMLQIVKRSMKINVCSIGTLFGIAVDDGKVFYF